jgi:LPS export ABC transporter protein LptC
MYRRIDSIGNWITKGTLLALLFSVAACQQPKIEDLQLGENSQQGKNPDSESRLVLNNATLEQSNAKGQVLWKIQVDEAIYSKDQEIAHLKQVKGNIYQDEQVVLYISADRGEVYESGEKIFLKDNIVATDPRNGTVIRSEEVEWHPQESLLMARKKLRGSSSELEVSAREGRYQTQKQRLELIGDIVATAKQPKVQLNAEQMLWKVPEQKLLTDRPLKLVRYQDKIISDQIRAEKGEVDLKAKVAVIKNNIEYRSLKPPIQIASNRVDWNYKQRLVTSNEPIRILHDQEQITITANRAQVNLVEEVAYLKGGVQGVNNKTQAKLYSNELIWQMPSQIVEALGNVIYEQSEPKMNLTGDRAVGTIKDNKIVVTSNSRERVVTEIFPEG